MKPPETDMDTRTTSSARPLTWSFLLCVCIVLSACDGSEEAPDLTCADWGYEVDNGPANWGDLCSATCDGMSQSPIDIETAAVVDESLPDIVFDYAETEFELFNNGHTIEAADETDPKTNSLELDEKKYELTQFHFHSLSEHTVDGEHFPIEMHLVHRFSDSDLVVVGAMITHGAENTTLAPVWDALPADEAAPSRTVDVNLDLLLSESPAYYRYEGSLTTPNGSTPSASCAEIVTWIILKNPLQMSANQIADFQAIFDHNYRPTQPLNGRMVTG